MAFNESIVERALSLVANHSTMKALAEELGMVANTLRYELGKARKLDTVKFILQKNKELMK